MPKSVSPRAVVAAAVAFGGVFLGKLLLDWVRVKSLQEASVALTIGSSVALIAGFLLALFLVAAGFTAKRLRVIHLLLAAYLSWVAANVLVVLLFRPIAGVRLGLLAQALSAGFLETAPWSEWRLYLRQPMELEAVLAGVLIARAAAHRARPRFATKGDTQLDGPEGGPEA